MPRGVRGSNRRYAASALDPRAKVQLTGPFFEPSADKRLRENIRGMLAAVADEGTRVVRARSPHLTGDLIAGIQPRTSGQTKWALSSVIVATHIYPWPGNPNGNYRGGKAEARYRMFRAATTQMRSARAVLAANLTEGLE